MLRVLVLAVAMASLSAFAAEPALGHDLAPPGSFPGAAPGQTLKAATRAEPATTATPRADCGPGSRPEGALQGRVPAGSDQGFACNLVELGHEGRSGGFKVERYVDPAGHECAFYDTTLLFPTNALTLSTQPTGVAVLDMSNPARPVRTATLITPAMQSPHESLVVNRKRGLLAAVMGTPATAPGFVDLYDVRTDCRRPVLQSTSPVGILGHESGFAPDGKTLYATSIGTGQVTAVDVSNPKLPSTLGIYPYAVHGMNLSDDGNRAYMATSGEGLLIADTSQIQARKANPQMPIVSRLKWDSLTIPQNAEPVTIGGKPFVVEVDEYSATEPGGGVASNGPVVGAARIIDIADERNPKVVSNLRLAVHQPENRAAIAGDPGARLPVQGYAGHYCGVPQRSEPGIVACSFIASGLRVFDIRDPYKPRELGYFVTPPANLGGSVVPAERSNYAMSRPSFAPARGEIWYSDGNSGFHALKATNGAWPFAAGNSGGGRAPAKARPCRSRRSFVIHLRRGLRSARVFVAGRRVKVRRGRRLTARVDLRGRRKGIVKVRIVGRTRSGRRVTETRRYRPCTRRRS